MSKRSALTIALLGILLVLTAGCGMKRDCIIDAQGRKMCEEWQVVPPEIVVVVPQEPVHVHPYGYTCGPYDSRCKVQLGGGGFYGGIYGGGVHTHGDPNYGVIKDYYPYRNRRTGKVEQRYGPVGGGGWRSRHRGD